MYSDLNVEVIIEFNSRRMKPAKDSCRSARLVNNIYLTTEIHRGRGGENGKAKEALNMPRSQKYTI